MNEITEKQYEILNSKTRYTWVIGGIGSAKSYSLGLALIIMAAVPNSLGLITAPSRDVVHESTMPKIKEVLFNCGFVEDVDYIIGRSPKSLKWGVRPFSRNSNHIITWSWGAYTIIDGSENYGKHRGKELDYILVDEFRDIKEGAFDVFSGRLRGVGIKLLHEIYLRDKGVKQKNNETDDDYAARCEKIINKGISDNDYVYNVTNPAMYNKTIVPKVKLTDYKYLGVTTPPDTIGLIKKYISKPNSTLITATSFDNIKFLPLNYIRDQKNNLSDLEYRREVLGEMVDSGGSTVYHGFSNDNLVNVKFDPLRDSYLSWDFDYTAKSPMTTVLIQKFKSREVLDLEEIETKGIVDDEIYVVVKEFYNLNTRTQIQCEIIKDFLDGHKYNKEIKIYGDHAGNHQQSGADSANYSDYDRINEVLGNWIESSAYTRPTLSIKDRVEATNVMFCNYDGIRRLLVDYGCEYLTEDLNVVTWSENGKELNKKDKTKTHISDALTYFTYYEFSKI